MVKHTQTISWQIADLSVFDHFVGLTLKWLNDEANRDINEIEIVLAFRKRDRSHDQQTRILRKIGKDYGKI